jgi:hypothetical protein
MLAKSKPTFNLSSESHHYSPEDLDALRRVFRRACEENPLLSATDQERYVLAKAVLKYYQRQARC